MWLLGRSGALPQKTLAILLGTFASTTEPHLHPRSRLCQASPWQQWNKLRTKEIESGETLAGVTAAWPSKYLQRHTGGGR